MLAPDLGSDKHRYCNEHWARWWVDGMEHKTTEAYDKDLAEILQPMKERREK